MTVHLLGGTLVFGINIICGQLFPFRWWLNLPKPTLHWNTNWCFGYGKVKLCQLWICGEKIQFELKNIFTSIKKLKHIFWYAMMKTVMVSFKKKKIVPSSGSFLTTLDIFSFPSLIFSFSSLMKKKKINFKVDKINFYKWEIHIKEENSSYNIPGNVSMLFTWFTDLFLRFSL